MPVGKTLSFLYQVPLIAANLQTKVIRMKNERPHVVIIGAGFGGIRAARKLAKSKVRITILDKHNYHLFQPLLYQVSTAGLSVDDVAYPIRAMLRQYENVVFRMAEVLAVDTETKTITLDDGNIIAYDYLVVSTGGKTNYFGMKNVAQHALGMKTLDEAVRVRNHVLQQFELASFEEDPNKRRALLTFAVVGGGPTGVESAGALSELIHQVLAKEYSRVNFKEVRIILVEAGGMLLPSMPEDLQEATMETLIRKYVEVRLCIQVEDFDGSRLFLKGGEIIPTHTVIWAAGVRAVDVLDSLRTEQDGLHRIKVNEFMQVPEQGQVFVIGDAAHFVQDGRPLPMIAPVAIQQADLVVKNICSLMAGQKLRPFQYSSVGNMATIGRNAAVVSMGFFKAQGILAWFIWSFVHILRLIDFRNRMVVFFKWVWEYFSYDRIVRIITRQ